MKIPFTTYLRKFTIKACILSANNIERWACSAELGENCRRNGRVYICHSTHSNFRFWKFHLLVPRCLKVFWWKRGCVLKFLLPIFFSLGVCLYNRVDAYTGKVKFKKEVSEGLHIWWELMAKVGVWVRWSGGKYKIIVASSSFPFPPNPETVFTVSIDRSESKWPCWKGGLRLYWL